MVGGKFAEKGIVWPKGIRHSLGRGKGIGLINIFHDFP